MKVSIAIGSLAATASAAVVNIEARGGGSGQGGGHDTYLPIVDSVRSSPFLLLSGPTLIGSDASKI